MYASYFYDYTITAANLLADLVKILTGTTDKAQLSASCVQASTSIDASVTAAGWAVYDASAGTNAQCLRAPVADNPDQYKYLVVDTNTAGYVKLKVYESWNASTHVGTNLAYTSDGTSSAQVWGALYGGRIDISASARHALMLSLYAGAYGCSTGRLFTGVMERTRRSYWDTVAAGYPPFVYVSNIYTSGYYECRRKDLTNCDDTQTATGLSHNSLKEANITANLPLDNFAFKAPMIPFGVTLMARGHLGGDISSLCDIWETHVNTDVYDLLTVDANEVYVVWPGSTTQRFAVRRG